MSERTPTFPRVKTFALDCPDTMALAGFYADLLGLEVMAGSDDDWAVVVLPEGVRLGFQHVADHVAPQWPDGEPQQAHLDLVADDLDAHHSHAVAVGARPYDPDETRAASVERGWRVYLDPAGHPFCLVCPPDGWT